MFEFIIFYEIVRDKTSSVCSAVDLMKYDPVAFPMFAGLPYSETVLAPGEALYIPRWTWHFVMAVDGPTARAKHADLEGMLSTAPTPSETINAATSVPTVGTDAAAPTAKRRRGRPIGSTSAHDNASAHSGSSTVAAGGGGDAAAPSEVEDTPHSFSVSFWWGERKEKPSRP